MRPLKVLHVASFSGNIGDILSHQGFYPWFENLLPTPISWTKFEIRNIFRGLASFDNDIVPLIESHDLTIFGGGNYFETWPENSRTGTSIDLSLQFLEKSNKPIFFNSLGVDVSLGVSGQASENLPKLFDIILGKENYILSVRNDGAAESLRQFTDSSNWSEVPDHGFFGSANTQLAKEEGDSAKTVSINLAQDMPELRFGSPVAVSNFVSKFAGQMINLVDSGSDIEIQFVPHIFSDLKLAAEIMQEIPDKYVRECISIAGLDTRFSNGLRSFSPYDRSDLVLANRFHANIYSLSRGLNTIGLVNHPQISKLYGGLGNLGVYRTTHNLWNSLDTLSESAVESLGFGESSVFQAQEVATKMRELRSNFEPHLSRWLRMNLSF